MVLYIFSTMYSQLSLLTEEYLAHKNIQSILIAGPLVGPMNL
jgi:hypothetical protein